MTLESRRPAAGFDPSVADAVASEIIGGARLPVMRTWNEPAACARIAEFAVERFGRLDALVHNAGLVVFAGLEETDRVVWDRMIAIGVDAPFHLARAAVPHMC